MPAHATVSSTTVADTDTFEFVEGNVYFPLSSIKNSEDVLSPSKRTSHCPWKGEAHYYDLQVNGMTVKDAAWYYPLPYEKASMIKDHVAFDKSKVKVVKE